jgi:hypothetical protein
VSTPSRVATPILGLPGHKLMLYRAGDILGMDMDTDTATSTIKRCDRPRGSAQRYQGIFGRAGLYEEHEKPVFLQSGLTGQRDRDDEGCLRRRSDRHSGCDIAFPGGIYGRLTRSE